MKKLSPKTKKFLVGFVVVVVLVAVGILIWRFVLSKKSPSSTDAQYQSVLNKMKTLPRVAGGGCSKDSQCPQYYKCVSGARVLCDNPYKPTLSKSDFLDCVNRSSNVPLPSKKSASVSCTSDCDCLGLDTDPNVSYGCNTSLGRCVPCESSDDAGTPDEDCCQAGKNAGQVYSQCYNDCKSGGGVDCDLKCYKCPTCGAGPIPQQNTCYKCANGQCVQIDSCPDPTTDPGYPYYENDPNCMGGCGVCENDEDCNNGTCNFDQHICVCNKGWTGERCDQQVKNNNTLYRRQ